MAHHPLAVLSSSDTPYCTEFSRACQHVTVEALCRGTKEATRNDGSLYNRLQRDEEVAGVVDAQALTELHDRRRTRFLDEERAW